MYDEISSLFVSILGCFHDAFLFTFIKFICSIKENWNKIFNCLLIKSFLDMKHKKQP